MAFMWNINDENFGELTAGNNVVISHYAIVFNADSVSTTAGMERLVLVSRALTHSRTLAAGDPMQFLKYSFALDLPQGEGGAALDNAMLNALLHRYGNPTVLLGTGALGANADAAGMEMTGRGYSRQVIEMAVGDAVPTS